MVLLVVQRIVLQADGRTVILCAACVGYCQKTAEQRVLTQVFIRAPAGRYALYVDSGAENHVLAAQAGLTAHAPPVGVGPLCAPCRSQRRTCGKERGRVGSQMGRIPRMGLHLLADAERTVGILHIGNAQPLDARRREHVLTVKHSHLLFQRHPTDDAVNLRLMAEQFRGVGLSLRRDRRNGQQRANE